MNIYEHLFTSGIYISPSLGSNLHVLASKWPPLSNVEFSKTNSKQQKPLLQHADSVISAIIDFNEKCLKYNAIILQHNNILLQTFFFKINDSRDKVTVKTTCFFRFFQQAVFFCLFKRNDTS